MKTAERPVGTLISGTALLQTLADPDHVFRAGSWTEDNVRGAGYDLRLAGDCLVYPAAPGASSYTAVDNNEPDVEYFVLEPGDSALISTIEKCSFDFDVAGTVGPKFFFASQGLLMLNGNAVHPGYGRRFNRKDGAWHPEDDVRLHFIVANVGPYQIPLHRGDVIAHLQLFSVAPELGNVDTKTQQFSKLRGRLFSGGSIYFRTIQDLRTEADGLKDRLEAIERRAAAHDSAISRVNDVTSLIIVFGVFLISSTLLGFVLTALVSLFEKLPAHISGGREALIAVFASLYGVCCTVGVALVVAVIWPVIRRMAHQNNG